MNRSTRFSLTIPSEAAKKASTCEMKNLEVLKKKMKLVNFGVDRRGQVF